MKRSGPRNQNSITHFERKLSQALPARAAIEFKNVVDTPEKAELLSLLIAHARAGSDDAIVQMQGQLETLKEEIAKQKNEIVEVQKIDPVLEATIRVGMENLTERIRTLEAKQLGKWEVAVVCGTVIAGIALVLGAASGAIMYITGHLK